MIRGLRDVIRRRRDTSAPEKYQGIIRVYRLLRIAGTFGNPEEAGGNPENVIEPIVFP